MQDLDELLVHLQHTSEELEDALPSSSRTFISWAANVNWVNLLVVVFVLILVCVILYPALKMYGCICLPNCRKSQKIVPFSIDPSEPIESEPIDTEPVNMDFVREQENLDGLRR